MVYNVEVTSSDDYTYNKLTILDDEGRREYRDYGEPEDNSFLRDYNWIAKELRSAYLKGKRDRQDEIYNGRR